MLAFLSGTQPGAGSQGPIVSALLLSSHPGCSKSGGGGYTELLKPMVAETDCRVLKVCGIHLLKSWRVK